MNCLYCNKPLEEKSNNHWHNRCIKEFFGTSTMPIIDLSDKSIERITKENINKGFTIPGVQKKISLHLYSERKNPRLTIVNYPTGYILKPQVKEYSCLPEAEFLTMHMARICGIKVVPNALIYNSNTYAYITKRIDRIITSDKVYPLAMEDFCQLDLRLTRDKYQSSYERCAKIITKYSSFTMLDLSELFIRIVFSFIVGNSDMHLKNFSLIEREGTNEYSLSPAYDLLPVNILFKEDKEEVALTLNGKKKNLTKKDFLTFASICGLSLASSNKLIKDLLSKKQQLIDICNNSLLSDDLKKSFVELINNRCDRLS